MDRLLIFIIFNLLATVTSDSINCATTKRGEAVTFTCTDQKNLTALDTAPANTTSIEIFDSKIPSVHGHAFSRFAASLVTLDLHGSGIEFIDQSAFIGLTKLEKLILWGNKLRTVPRDWFAYTYSLKTLDLSFNFIEVIDYAVFQMLSNLENFYFDYNQIKFIDYTMFAYLKSLKNVKFEKNPLSWGYRAHLTWQLENQHVKYTEQYENWGWMNVAIKECTDSGYGEIPTDTVLDCIVAKLLDFTHKVFSTEIGQSSNVCANQAIGLVQCVRSQNRTYNTDNETVRKILEDYAAILLPMSKSRGRFSSPIYL
ncbi:leucine-rich repeat, immunoglobulin-like domain and transmembrane domain-containing protein 2 [Hylaeus anthracinus]|uniref:leucine-rich repeat, immunoglobulin-like domain and transmembrane domain-containing protein 2 n=1 Tax=Hylaeus anthracinus TaxID=313031 RepID=UPI0023B94A28|nr:leucine-rich repeat, immunoglobulin-like domain and transmembrane domain-containing protein 2 [Hylaeus anthracinus]